MTVAEPQATAANAFEHYLCVRDWAQRMAAMDRTAALARTEEERRVAAALAPLWSATPEMIAWLRRWAAPLSGGRAAEYEDPDSRIGKGIRRDVKRLSQQVGLDLFVPESSLLGGFGCATSGGRCSTETLKFFSALVALEDGAVLPDFRGGSRRLVWEIGGGWGGFGYQFKTICPNVTHLITSSPDAFLVSAVYLMTAFPDARYGFWDQETSKNIWDRWEDIDFIFAPESALSQFEPPCLDLTLDLGALAQMTPERMARHLDRAFHARCRYVYSLHAGDWTAGEMPAVWRAIEHLYWLNAVPPRVELHKAEPDYSHVIGWRRIRV